MSAISAIVINDGQATPVAHTFAPVNIDVAGIANYADRSGGIAIGYPRLSILVREPSKTSRVYKVTFKVTTPILEQTSPSTSTGIQPAPTKAFDLTFVGEMMLPERSTLAQRKDLLAYVKNFIANAVMTSAVNDFESVY